MVEETSKLSGKILFYRETEENGYLCNYYRAPIELEGLVWPTIEHYF